jgi:lipoate-protein ligase A
VNFTKLSVYISPSSDPYLNLALENQLLKTVSAHEKILFFYTNAPCVVMGRFQNPWVECKLSKMLEHQVALVRRQSGGGTVYHDEGNLNFCFMQAVRDHLKDDNNQILVDALSALYIQAQASGRSDLIIVESKLKETTHFKFSGSAFKQKKDRSFHHGTLLINSNLENLNDFLLPKERKIDALGVRSVRSKVVNLSSLNRSIQSKLLQDAIVKSCQSFYQIDDVSYYSSSVIEELLIDEEVLAYDKSLRLWNWMFGETPLFKLELALQNGACYLEVKKAIIVKCEIEHNSLHPGLVQEICTSLSNAPFRAQDLSSVLRSLQVTYSMFTRELKDLEQALINEVEL